MSEKLIIVVKKVSIEELMDALVELHEVGVENVDLCVDKNEESSFFLVFDKEYMAEEFKDQYEKISGEIHKIDSKFSEDDLNQIS